MTKNYTDIFQQNIRTPETVADAVNRLLMAMEGEQKVVLAVMQEKDLINLRFSLGKGIRNAFRLHEPGVNCWPRVKMPFILRLHTMLFILMILLV